VTIAEEVQQQVGGDGFQHYKVRARLAVFNKRFKEAESIYLEGVSWS
jgi:intraflagellar transport protein 172